MFFNGGTDLSFFDGGTNLSLPMVVQNFHFLREVQIFHFWFHLQLRYRFFLFLTEVLFITKSESPTQKWIMTIMKMRMIMKAIFFIVKSSTIVDYCKRKMMHNNSCPLKHQSDQAQITTALWWIRLTIC